MTQQKTFAALKLRVVENKKKIIIDAAERVFGSKPFKNVNIRDIAREAGISHATIYSYFADQQSLFVEAFVQGVKEIEERVQAIAEDKKQDKIGRIAQTYIDFLSENDHYFKMMTNFMLDGNLGNEPLEKLNTMARSLLDLFERVLKQEHSQGNTRKLAHNFFAALNGILITFRDYPGRTKQEVRRHMQELARQTADLFRNHAKNY
jgi:AcrR family transcriptional regulator